MSYLMIRNPGVADYRGLTVMGISTTRNSGNSDAIGTFGSGTKHAISVMLRAGISPIIHCGNLKMTFDTRKEVVKDDIFHRVCVTYSGFDHEGNSKNSTEDLGFVLEWGTADWTRPTMGFREFISNAIDSSLLSTGTYDDVEVEVVEDNQVRAKRKHTSVFLPYNDTVKEMHEAMGTLFLHFSHPELLKCKCLPKRNPNDDKVLVYKKGVLVSWVKGKSVFDYNLGDELQLDESRNAPDWAVRHAVASTLRDETPHNLAKILLGIIADDLLWEARLDASSLGINSYAKEEVKVKQKEEWSTAWTAAAGPKAVVSSGSVALASFVLEKGFTPVKTSDGWREALESYGILSETKVLSKNELDGQVVLEATDVMKACVEKVWKLFEAFNLTNGKSMPGVKGFKKIMDGSSQTGGYYRPGESDIYLHEALGEGKGMFKVALEECTHYATGSDDKSRDIQDFLFNLVTDMAF